MITIKRETLQAIVRMSKNVGSSDATRPMLSAVVLDSVDRRLRLRVCDGFMMNESTHEIENLPELLENKEAFVYPHDVKIIETVLKSANKHQQTFQVVIEDKQLKLSSDVKTYFKIGEINDKGTYPSTDAIKPSVDDYELEVGLNAEKLYKLLKSLDDPSGGKTVKLTFRAKKSDIWQIDKTAAIMVESPNSNLKEYALIMPVRV